MKKIIFVIQSMRLGGAERSLVNLLQELPKDDYVVDLLLFKKDGDFLQFVPKWVNCLEIPHGMRELYAPVRRSGKYLMTRVLGTVCAKVFYRSPKRASAFRWKFFYRKKIGMLPNHYDIAVAYSGSEVQYLVRDCISADRKIVWIHNDYRTAGYSRKDDLPYFADMDAIVSVSNKCVDTLCDIYPEYKERIHYIENITSSTIVRNQASSYSPEEYSDEGNILLSIGRLNLQKGFDMAVDAAKILKQKNVRFHWYIVGEGKLKETLEKQIQENDVEDCVTLLGTRSNPYPYILNCTMLVQSSRFEGKSVVLDEAKILGTPIVATCYPTVKDQILDGKEGIIVPMSPEGIAQGIDELLHDPNRLKEIRCYLKNHEYGNQKEVLRYIDLIG